MTRKQFILELEPGVWWSDGSGDPPRTTVRENAMRFSAHGYAQIALGCARKYREFSAARIESVESEAAASEPEEDPPCSECTATDRCSHPEERRSDCPPVGYVAPFGEEPEARVERLELALGELLESIEATGVEVISNTQAGCARVLAAKRAAKLNLIAIPKNPPSPNP